MYYDDVDKGIIMMLQGDILVDPEPYRALAESLKLSQEQLLSRIQDMKESGKIRRLGAVLRHRKSGYLFNAMVVFKVSEDKADQAGQVLAACPQVTHCYLREVPEDFDYNLFAMIHLRGEGELLPLLRDLLDKSGLDDYRVIKSIKEFKKVSMEYIQP